MKDTYKVPERLIDELIEVRPGVLVLQLNGTGHIESVQQLARLMEERIEQTNSSVIVVDLTNTQDVDGVTARYVADSISVVQRLGAQVIFRLQEQDRPATQAICVSGTLRYVYDIGPHSA